jgi:hypothetical protein
MKRFLSGIGGISSCFYAIMYGTIATRSAMEGCAGSQEFETKLKIKFYLMLCNDLIERVGARANGSNNISKKEYIIWLISKHLLA